jgi:hypothetical protein
VLCGGLQCWGEVRGITIREEATERHSIGAHACWGSTLATGVTPNRARALSLSLSLSLSGELQNSG